MIDIALIREQPEWVRERLATLNDPAALERMDAVFALDLQRRAVLVEAENAQAARNKLNKAAGMLRGSKALDDARRFALAAAAAEAIKPTITNGPPPCSPTRRMPRCYRLMPRRLVRSTPRSAASAIMLRRSTSSWPRLKRSSTKPCSGFPTCRTKAFRFSLARNITSPGRLRACCRNSISSLSRTGTSARRSASLILSAAFASTARVASSCRGWARVFSGR